MHVAYEYTLQYAFNDYLLVILGVWLQRGVTGTTVLSLHQPFSLPSGVVIDDLHSIYLGVVLQMLHLWCDKQHRGKPFYIGQKVLTDIINICCFFVP